MKLQKALFFLISFASMTGFCQSNVKGVTLAKGCPAHEAFLTKEYNEIILLPVAVAPPMPLKEKIPQQPDPEMKWISGYWSWSKDMNDFIWVSGIWRRSPQGLHWINGYWKQYDNQYGWNPGFWIKEDENNLQYIKEVPPDDVQEEIPASPGENYYWRKGFWQWDGSSYQWSSGRWQPFEENFVFTPARYVWRDRWDRNGFIFVPSFFDWNIEKRGMAFACAVVLPALRSKLVYDPLSFAQMNDLITSCFPYYPNYAFFLHHHYYYHSEYWKGFSGLPSWWGWPEWWTLNTNDAWALFWWWSHSNMPPPNWMTAYLALKIAPPTNYISEIVNITPPPNVSRLGVVKNSDIVKAIKKTTGKSVPLMPIDPDRAMDILEMVKPQEGPENNSLRPTGRGQSGPYPLPLGKAKEAPQAIQEPVQNKEAPQTPGSSSSDKGQSMPMNEEKSTSFRKQEFSRESLSFASSIFLYSQKWMKKSAPISTTAPSQMDKKKMTPTSHADPGRGNNYDKGKPDFFQQTAERNRQFLMGFSATIASSLTESLQKCRMDFCSFVAANDTSWKGYRNTPPPKPTPVQGIIPHEEWPPRPFSQQNLGNFMNNDLGNFMNSPRQLNEMRPGVCYHIYGHNQCQ